MNKKIYEDFFPIIHFDDSKKDNIGMVKSLDSEIIEDFFNLFLGEIDDCKNRIQNLSQSEVIAICKEILNLSGKNFTQYKKEKKANSAFFISHYSLISNPFIKSSKSVNFTSLEKEISVDQIFSIIFLLLINEAIFYLFSEENSKKTINKNRFLFAKVLAITYYSSLYGALNNFETNNQKELFNSLNSVSLSLIKSRNKPKENAKLKGAKPREFFISEFKKFKEKTPRRDNELIKHQIIDAHKNTFKNYGRSLNRLPITAGEWIDNFILETEWYKNLLNK